MSAERITLKDISSPARPKRESIYLVLRDGVPTGVISKYRDDQHTCNPWKAFAGIGMQGRFVGTFHDVEAIKRFYNGMPTGDQVKGMRFGGKDAAINAALGNA